jgi:hypothetical protein
VLDLFWISLGILCGISGAYSAWDTMPRTALQWLIMVTVGALSGWFGGIVLAAFGLELIAFLGAMAAGFFVTWGVFVGLRGTLVSHEDLGDRFQEDDLVGMSPEPEDREGDDRPPHPTDPARGGARDRARDRDRTDRDTTTSA